MSHARFASLVLALSASIVGQAALATPAALCPPAPSSGCRPANKSLLSITVAATPERAKLRWWGNNPSGTTFADFGDPTVSTSYAFCLYDTSDRTQPLMFDEAPAATACATEPCWELYASTVFLYSDGRHASDGLSQFKLKVSTGGGSLLGVKGKGAGLGAPEFPLTTPVRVQIHRSGSSVCWEATYVNPARNNPVTFFAHD